jgi:hypothetical protein
MKNLSPTEIVAARKRGAEAQIVAKKVEVVGLDGLVLAMKSIIESNHAIVKTLDMIVQAIGEKELKGTDVSELVKAVSSLKQDVETAPEIPLEWEVNFERDGRHHIKPGLRISAINTKPRLN